MNLEKELTVCRKMLHLSTILLRYFFDSHLHYAWTVGYSNATKE